MTTSILKQIQIHKRFKKQQQQNAYLLGQKHSLQIFWVIPFVKLQNNT